MKIAFEQSAFQDFNDWAQTDRKIYQRIVSLINDIARNPHSGLGKPEPLKHQLQGFWSRRIDQEHRGTKWRMPNRRLQISLPLIPK